MIIIKKHVFTILVIVCNITSINTKKGDVVTQKNDKVQITPKIYSNIFVRKREEQKLLIKHLMESDNYEKNFKMLQLGLEKILDIISDNKMALHQTGYNPKSGFPIDEKLQDSVALILENICLSGDLILRLPDISYRILKKISNWRETFNWAIEFANEYVHIIDEKTVEMLELFRMEINPKERSEDFVNPYYEAYAKKQENKEPIKERKPRKRIKRGPRLTNHLEL